MAHVATSERQLHAQTVKTGLWLAGNEGMEKKMEATILDPNSSPYLTHCSSFHFLLHSFMPS